MIYLSILSNIVIKGGCRRHKGGVKIEQVNFIDFSYVML